MTLVDVYGHPKAIEWLYKLLKERRAEVNISHKKMPDFSEHAAFVQGEPYEAWYLIETKDGVIGSIYLTHAREVGIFIFEAHQHKGYGRQAIAELRRHHPGRLLANVAPTNHRSIQFFKRMGARHIQNTYEL